MTYLYGMKLRGFSIGCQPKQGLIERQDDTSGNYHDILVYDRKLTDEELKRYELDFIEEKGKDKDMDKATITPMIQELESLFSKLNERYFNGELEKPVITIAPDTCRAYGWFTTWRAWKETDNKDADGYYEITITSDYLDRDPIDIAGTLLHEMIHLYNQMNGVNDTSRSGKYHNKNFKLAAEAHGLVCEKTKTYGFSDTTPTTETADYLKSLDLKFSLYRPTPETGQVIKKSSTRKYVCPVCGQIIRATKEVNVVCGDCGVPFVEEV